MLFFAHVFPQRKRYSLTLFLMIQAQVRFQAWQCAAALTQSLADDRPFAVRPNLPAQDRDKGNSWNKHRDGPAQERKGDAGRVDWGGGGSGEHWERVSDLRISISQWTLAGNEIYLSGHRLGTKYISVDTERKDDDIILSGSFLVWLQGTRSEDASWPGNVDNMQTAPFCRLRMIVLSKSMRQRHFYLLRIELRMA